jgi:hypothetical protein
VAEHTSASTPLPTNPRIGICADVLVEWAGGTDLVVYVIKSLQAARPDAALTVLLPGEPPPVRKPSWGSFRNTIKSLFGSSPDQESPAGDREYLASELVRRIRAVSRSIGFCYSAGLDAGLAKAAKDMRLDAIYLAMRRPTPRPACAIVGYVPDYQHKHLPGLFTESERSGRDRLFGELVADSDAMVMNARAVAEDMRLFTAATLPPLHVLPFSPHLDKDWLKDMPEVLTKYGITRPYFIICNQFWMHKDHLTAMRAVASVLKSGKDISLICTGGTTDYRDRTYFARVEAEAAALGLGSRLRFLGHIHKRDQIELLKRAVALVQPTLFEGGPGGGSTYEAVALGQRVLLSDLPVNREIDAGDVRFFGPGDPVALAQLMEAALSDQEDLREPARLIAQSEERLRRNGEAIWASIQSALRRRLARQA